MTPGAAPLRFLRERLRPGTRCAALTLEAVEAWLLSTHRDPRRVAWVADELGERAEPVWRALGVYPQRIVRERLTWSPALEREGVPAIIVPIWDTDPVHHAGLVVVDLVAVDVADPARPIARRGCVQALGELEVERALFEGVPIVWHADALSWLRAGGNGERFAGLEREVAHFFPFQIDGALAERVLAEAVEILGGTVALAERLHELEAEVRALRAPRRVPVHVLADALEG